MYKIVAFNDCYNHHGHSEKGRVIDASEAELRASAKARKLPDTALFPLPHFRFVNEDMNKKAQDALAKPKEAAKPEAEPEKAPETAPETEKKGKPGKKAQDALAKPKEAAKPEAEPEKAPETAPETEKKGKPGKKAQDAD
jgi:hypothetical protein